MIDVMDCENQRKSWLIPALFVWKVLRKQGIYSVSGRGIWCAVRVMADTVGLAACSQQAARKMLDRLVIRNRIW